ncbi:D-2-hydroxyacid dehydrogenase family protein [Devosia sp. MC1541]|uniref:D-2-hydroxyacid dehydrogenase family protein n=1 Tax=Devosia sp. MC1541 TaxID=2725264 RepID=UPI00145E438C|nr:D-2-hydroxyacid dehydrogenase family protein [Devosia sp. MC1541]
MTSARLGCVVLDDYQSAAKGAADWSQLEHAVDVEFEKRFIGEPEALIERLQNADIVVANRERTRFDAATLAALPKLKLLVTTGMGNAAIDMLAAKSRNIVVSGTGSDGAPTAELTWALILAMARSIVPEANGIRAGAWQSSLGFALSGRTLGLVGLGRVGSAVAKVGTAFGMRVAAWSPRLDDERAAAAGVERASSLEALFQSGDVISLHATLTPESRGLVDAKLLGLMKPSAYLVNTSRAGLIDEAALIAVLKRDGIAGVALDVFATEPTQADNPLFAFERVLATPHLGYVTDVTYAAFFSQALEDILAFLAGTPIRVLN